MNSQQALLLYDLIRRARDAETGQQLQFLLLNQSYSLLPYQVAVLWTSSVGVLGVSNVTSVDSNAPFTLWLDRLLRSVSDSPSAQRLSPPDVPSDVALAWRENLPFFAATISCSHGTDRVVVIFARDEPWQDAELVLLGEWFKTWASYWTQRDAAGARFGRVVRTWYESLPPFVAVKQAVTETTLGARHVIRHFLDKPSSVLVELASLLVKYLRVGMRSLAQPQQSLLAMNEFLNDTWSDRGRRYRALALVVIFFPVRLTVLAPAELVAANPAVIRSPLDGVVEQVVVRPNQLVEEGQELVRLDTTTLSSRFQVAQQERQIASTEFRQGSLQSLTDAKSRGQLAIQQGRANERQLESDYLRELVAKAQMKAPRQGVVIMGDPSEWLGKPIQAGEKIMVIANPQEVEIEAWISPGDALPFKDGAKVTLFTNTSPLSPVRGQLLAWSHEASQRPDGSYAYRLRAAVPEDSDGHRIGVKGVARVVGDFVPLSYWLLRKPLASLRQLIGL